MVQWDWWSIESQVLGPKPLVMKWDLIAFPIGPLESAAETVAPTVEFLVAPQNQLRSAKKCDASLCVTARDCFKTFHTVKNLWKVDFVNFVRFRSDYSIGTILYQKISTK